MEEKGRLPEGIEWPRFEDETPVRFGDMGLDVHGRPRPVMSVKFTQAGLTFIGDDMGVTWWGNDTGPMEDLEIDHGKRVKRPPVLAADGRPLREGETVWDGKGNGPYIIDAIKGDGVVRIKGNDLDYFGTDFTHERPESWERLEEDAEKDPCGYFGFDEEETCGKCPASGKNCEQTMARDLVRRAKELEGVDK